MRRQVGRRGRLHSLLKADSLVAAIRAIHIQLSHIDFRCLAVLTSLFVICFRGIEFVQNSRRQLLADFKALGSITPKYAGIFLVRRSRSELNAK
jgi:hypothetical protein